MDRRYQHLSSEDRGAILAAHTDNRTGPGTDGYAGVAYIRSVKELSTRGGPATASGRCHSDHRITFEAASACTKWFRYPRVKRLLTYETISETDAGLDPTRGFQPTVFVDISEYLVREIDLMQVYASEMGSFPFPRSDEALQALAKVRGAQAGFAAAEAFTLLRERS